MLFLEQLLERAKGLPGVREAAVASKIPLRGGNNNTIFAGKPGEWRNLGQMEITPVSRGYFSAAGLALLKGRAFDPGDADGQAGHVVVNRTLANLAWPGKDALGKMLFPYSMILDTPESAGAKAMTVVGVVEDAPQRGVRERMTGEIYQLSQGESFSRLVFAYLVVRSSQDARPLGKLLQREVAAIDPEQPFRIMTWRSVLDMATQLERFLMMLMIVFTVCAIGLAMVGIYGTFSYYVAERTKEIGLRMALGATRAGVVGTVLRRLGVWMGIGLALGAGGVFAGARYLQAMLFEMEPVHPPVLIASVALVLATGLLAGLIPALRATKIQPLEALRAE